MSKVDDFERLRPLLFAIAYRILGSVSEAEDAVQETWLRWEQSTTPVRSVKDFLAATVTRISIDVLRSARRQRETYPGPWLPEPLLDDPYVDPARAAELADSLSTAALVLLERLSPLERAVFVLRDVFGFGFADIATTVGRSEDACRQLAVRARNHMKDSRPRFEADRAGRDALAARFFDALQDGDVDRLRQLLAADVVAIGDSGGKAPALAKGVSGNRNVARALASIFAKLAAVEASVQPRQINGQLGAIVYDRDGDIVTTMTIDAGAEQIQTIRFVLSPDKLSHLGPVADPWEFAARAAQIGKRR
ncbi:RNA polymerase sigma-70 factor [Jongsikchunia kroppenstedtii]|uniref:RNA polymerase sigma-70 factor n=1 Tax=Jongsikchunia kroppenstedtii TaxID=1121721 RepID=UPI00036A01E2|nr:RNA polymerase sigma-70 factor [Jongsikchunia kroppenstedtii]